MQNFNLYAIKHELQCFDSSNTSEDGFDGVVSIKYLLSPSSVPHTLQGALHMLSWLQRRCFLKAFTYSGSDAIHGLGLES